MKKHISKKAKKFLIVALIVVFIFAVLNAAWIIIMFMPYNNYAVNMIRDTDSSSSRAYIAEDESGYMYRLRKPVYLSFDGGFMSVEKGKMKLYVDKTTGDLIPENNEKLVLFIWPIKYGRGYKYGLNYTNFNAEEYLNFIIDENMNLVTDDTDSAATKHLEEIIEKNYNQLYSMMNAAVEFWDLE